MNIATAVTFPIQSLHLSPGSHVFINSVSWETYEQLLTTLDHDSTTEKIGRIHYYQGTLEIMSPLPIHERPHRIIADIVKILLEAQGQDWEDFGSTRFKKPPQAGVEPDTCFYIQNAAQVRQNFRIDLSIDPPPDLVIEVDVTSKTTLSAYEVISVPEIWIYENQRLNIYILQQEGYQLTTKSRIFPQFNLVEMIPRLIQQVYQEGTRQTLRQLRQSFNL